MKEELRVVLDAIYRGELLPCENNMEGNGRHKQAGKEIEQLLKDLRNNLRMIWHWWTRCWNRH